MPDTLNRVRVVMVATSHPGNIGSCARAMKTMGLSRLVLVAPRHFPHEEATALAAGADDVLESALVVHTLAEALSGTVSAYGCTARVRGVALPEKRPREAAAELVALARGGADVALVFGNERTGLTNEELFQCRAAVHIPANPAYSSLNVAAAVQVLAYEARLAALEADELARPAQVGGDAGGAGDGDEPIDRPADAALLEGYFGHLERALAAIDFFKGRAPDTLMRRLRRLYFRAAPTEREVMILRGILSDTERLARLAGRSEQQD